VNFLYVQLTSIHFIICPIHLLASSFQNQIHLRFIIVDWTALQICPLEFSIPAFSDAAI
jgi:hypothetical protein